MTSQRILIVDDDDDLRAGISAVLTAAGYHTANAPDGERGLVEAIEFSPELVVTDVMMPRMDGWTLVKALRSRYAFALTPVIFLTSLDTQEDALQGYMLGADDYVPKSNSLTELPTRVEGVFSRRAGLHRLADETRSTLADSDRCAVRGSLQELGLPAVLSMLAMERKTGRLRVDRPRGDSAILFVRGGNVIGAELENGGVLRDTHLIFHVLAWNRGTFEFMALPMIDREDVVNTQTMHLLMEAARRQDEQRNASLPDRNSCFFPYA